MYFIPVNKDEFSVPLIQSHDPSEIILIFWFDYYGVDGGGPPWTKKCQGQFVVPCPALVNIMQWEYIRK